MLVDVEVVGSRRSHNATECLCGERRSCSEHNDLDEGPWCGSCEMEDADEFCETFLWSQLDDHSWKLWSVSE